MKLLGIVAIIAMFLTGCAQFQRSEVIDTGKLNGYASGTYKDDSTGPVGSLGLVGSGAGWGAGGAGLGVAGIGVKTGPPPSGALNFARAIAMINYSKKLKSISYDESGGVVDYEFAQTPSPTPRTHYQQPGPGQKYPPSFGYQPVQ